MEIQRKVKYEEELDKNFLEEIKEMSGCEEIDRCIQCGTCSSSCPMAVYMDYPPKKTWASPAPYRAVIWLYCQFAFIITYPINSI